MNQQPTAHLLNPDQRYQAEVVREFAGDRQLFVETGTANGKFAAWASTQFDRVVTIEYVYSDYLRAIEVLTPYANVRVLHGDSGVVLSHLLVSVDEPAVFWLDAHAVDSTTPVPCATPVLAELECIMGHPGDNVILIDDARLFGTVAGYPTKDEVAAVVSWRGFTMTDSDDVLRIIKR